MKPSLVRTDPGHRRTMALSIEAIGNADERIVRELTERLEGQEVRTSIDADALETELVQAVRQAADAGVGIGPNCMSVRLWSENQPRIFARYWPAEDEQIRTSGGTLVPAAYSPWLITPKAIVGPAIHFGGPGGMSPEGVTFEVYVPPGPVWDGDTLIAGFDTRDRPPPPRG